MPFQERLSSPLGSQVREIQNENIYFINFLIFPFRNAINEWLPEFFVEKEAWGPIAKPQPQVEMVMPIIPIIPSINTCMSLTTTTTTSTNTRTVPEVNTTQLQALADVCSTVSSTMTPISNPVMNSLVSPTKVVTNEEIINPIPTTVASNIELPEKIPISIVPVPIMEAKGVEESIELNCELFQDASEAIPGKVDDISEREQGGSLNVDTMLDENSLSPLSAGVNEPMECSSSINSQISPKEVGKLVTDDVVMEESANDINVGLSYWQKREILINSLAEHARRELVIIAGIQCRYARSGGRYSS